MKQFYLCAIQPQVIPLDIDKNVDRCIGLMETVFKTKKPDLVVFPETVTTGFSLKKVGDNDASLSKVYFELKKKLPKIKLVITEFAKKNKVNIVFPTYVPSEIKNKFYNSAFFINQKGVIEEVYRKIFLFPTENWSIGGNKIVVWKTEFTKIGCMICFDGDYPELARKYSLKGVELIVRPSALLRDYTIWNSTNISRAYENQIYFCGVNSIGTDYAEKNFYGHSMLVNPYSKIVKHLGANEDFFVTKLEPKNAMDTSNIIVLDHIKELKKARLKFL
ncbi:MAG: carbon-nitrogen hydrolase family protein [Endomicrobiia bacterium]